MHTCFSNVLSRVFRQPRAAGSAAFTVANWLVPGSQQLPPGRHFSQRRRRREQASTPSEKTKIDAVDAQPGGDPFPCRDSPADRGHGGRASLWPKEARSSAEGAEPRTSIFLDKDLVKDPEAWIEKLEPYLGPDLRSPNHSQGTHQELDLKPEERPYYISKLLSRSRSFPDLDVLGYMAIIQGRWNAVRWIIKAVVDYHPEERVKLGDIDAFLGYKLLGMQALETRAKTNPVRAEKIGPDVPVRQSLDQLTGLRRLYEYGAEIRKGALGQIWRTLGNFILLAADRLEDSQRNAQSIMPFVLEMLAHFHHSGLIPDSVYQYDKGNQYHPSHQPPTMHLLSSRILTALSDAAWSAHETAVKEASKDQAQHNFLGHEIPGSRYKVRTPELGPEVWLELVLWSTLHGGWSLDGAAILYDMLAFEEKERRWSAIHWRGQDGSSTEHLTESGMLPFIGLRGVQANSPDRLFVERTISVEVVAAFVHALLNIIRAGVGKRGQTPEAVFDRIRKLKSLLSRSQTGLGGMSWDAVVIRFLESPGVSVENKPHLVQSLMTLVSPFGQESEYINAPTGRECSPNIPLYVLDASAAPLGIFHRVIRAHIKRGDTNGGFAALAQLQEFTDLNKSRSLKLFFDTLQAESNNESKRRNTFDSNIPEVEFPSYHPQLPTHLMASILNLAAESEAYEFGQWLLFSEDIDGPLIPRSKFRDPILAPALIKFGTATRDAKLVQDVILALTPIGGTLSDLPNSVLQAFLGSQIENRRWESVANILSFMTNRTEHSWTIGTLSRLTKELLLLEHSAPGLSNEAREESLAKAKSIYRAMARGVYGIEDRQRVEDAHISMCFLASVSPEWADFCKSLWLRTGIRYIAKDSNSRYRYRSIFATILQGVAQARGSVDAQRFFRKWCLDPADAPAAAETSAPGGVRMMSRFRPTRAEQLVRSPEQTVVVTHFDGEDICLRGRLLEPQISYLRSIYASALLERSQKTLSEEQEAEVHEVLEWAAAGLRFLGVEDEDIDRELGGMLSRGELRLEPRRKRFGFLDEDELNEAELLLFGGEGEGGSNNNGSVASGRGWLS